MKKKAAQLMNVLRSITEFAGSKQPSMRTRVHSSVCDHVRLEVFSFEKGRHAIVGYEKGGETWWIAVKGSLSEAICEAISHGSQASQIIEQQLSA